MVGNLSKFWVAVGGTIVTALQSIYPPTTHHWTVAVPAAITALLVYLVPNSGGSDAQGKGGASGQ
jgi:hypothetical protein